MLVPFNDLSRIHVDLLDDFSINLKNITLQNKFILGEEVEKFEANYSKFENYRFCVGVDNGTNAIELALRALNIGPGDEVIIPAMTFVATAFAVLRVGAKPVLVDVLENSPHMDFKKIEEAISKKTRAILYVSLHGTVQDLNIIKDLSIEKGLNFILDGAQSQGLKYQNKFISEFFDLMTTSFYPGKNLGALGDAGAILCNEQLIYEKLKLFRDWGAKAKYEHDEWGGNFRLDSIQASFLSAKLIKLPKHVEQRQKIALQYFSNLNPEYLRNQVPNSDHVYHVFEIQTNEREKLIEYLNGKGIQSAIHYPKPIHWNNFYSVLRPSWSLSNSEKFAQSTLSIPLFPKMTEHEIDYVISCLNDYKKQKVQIN